MNLIKIGKITSAHGIKGAVKIMAFTEELEGFLGFDEYYLQGEKPVKFKFVSNDGKLILAQIEGVSDRNKAEEFKGQEIFTSREQFEEVDDGEFYLVDLIGLMVVTKDGKKFGKVLEAENYGAGDVLEIELESGKKEMFAFTEEVFPEVDVAEGKVVIEVPEVVEAK